MPTQAGPMPDLFRVRPLVKGGGGGGGIAGMEFLHYVIVDEDHMENGSRRFRRAFSWKA